MGLDLGQARDFTAVAALERAELAGEWDAAMYAYKKVVALRLRHLERLPLGTAYPEVVERVLQIVRSPELAGRCHLVVDATGVGRPVVDLLLRARLGCTMLPAPITGGEAEFEGGRVLQGAEAGPDCRATGAFAVRRLAEIVGKIPHGATLAAEMAEMRVKVTAAGNAQYGAWREGTHNDLVLAVAMACWGARTIYPNGPYGEEAYWRRKDQDEWAERLQKSTRGRPEDNR